MNKHNNQCYRCGGCFPHGKNQSCPAKGKTCNKCGKGNHLAAVCRSNSSKEFAKQITTGDEQNVDLDSSNEVTWAINSTGKGPQIVLELGKATDTDKSRVTFTIDTGCSINIIDKLTYNTLHPKPNLQKSNTKAYAYNSKIMV